MKQTTLDGAAVTKTTTYIGADFERIAFASGPDELVHYIRAGGAAVAIFTRTDDGSAATDKTRWLHKDHLGAIDLVTDEAGLITETRSFDAWGKPRNADWTPAPIDPPLAETPRGFTGHEHIQTVGLIHMNGRVYDPVIGRFLSADPIVQAPANTQSHNRYSYVLNNPLSFTDPSGFWSLRNLLGEIAKPFRALGRATRRLLPTIMTIAIPIAACFPPTPLCAAVAGAITSGVMALAQGGDLTDALMAAATTAASVYAFSQLHNWTPGSPAGMAGKVIAHGTVGGVASRLRGDNFASGFLSAGFVQGLSQTEFFTKLGLEGAPTSIGRRMKNAAVAAVVGGTASELGGGKFGNGAITGAFSRLYNDLLYDKKIFGVDIEKIKQTEIGRKVINDLEESEAIFIIQAPDKIFNVIAKFLGMDPVAEYRFMTNTITMEPGMAAKIATGESTFEILTSDAVLFHELAHAHLDLLGFRTGNMYVIQNYENPYTGFNRINAGATLYHSLEGALK